MKVLKVIRNIIVGIIVVVFFAFAIAMTILLLNRNDYGVTQFDNTSLVIVKEEFSSEKYQKNDLVIVENKALNKFAPGDELFIYKVTNNAVTIETGIVGEVYVEDEAISFENGATYASKFIIGIPDKIYNDIGGYLSIILSQWGFLFIILVPSFLIFIYEIYAIVVEIKYGKVEKKEEEK